MAKIKQTFLSDDDKEFGTEAEADARNMFLKTENSIEAYILAAGLQKAQAGLMRKHIAGYLSFAEKGAIELSAAAVGNVEVGDDTGGEAQGGGE